MIAVPTQSGSTARQVSRFRPRRPIVAASPYQHVLQQLALDWAVVPIVIDDAELDRGAVAAAWPTRSRTAAWRRPATGSC